MKKIIALALTFALAFSFSACKENVPSQHESHEHVNSLHMLTDPTGVFSVAQQTEAGYYDEFRHTEAGTTMLYTDFETKSRVFLCNQPNCQHMDDTCSAFEPMESDVYMDEGNFVYAFRRGYGTSDDEESTRSRIWRMNLDGSNHELVYAFENENFRGPIASDGERFYFLLQYYKTKTGQSPTKLVSLDTASKKLEVLYDFGEDYGYDGTDWVGCVGREIVLAKRSNKENSNQISANYTALNIDTLAMRDITKEPIVYNYCFWSDGKTIWYDEDLTKINTLIYETGEIRETKLEESFPKDVYFWQEWDDHLVYSTGEGENESFYTLDLNTGKRNMCITYFEEALNAKSPLHILANAEDSYLVCMQSEPVKGLFYHTDGTTENNILTISRQALIKKEDYWAGNKNLTMIDDHVN